MARRSTIKDVARESGVDVSTVSRSLNHKGYVNPETRMRILAAAERLNYMPNRLARGLVTGDSHTLGLIISDIRNPFFAEMARGVEDSANHAGFDLVLCNSDLHPEKQRRYIKSLASRGIDGIIVNWAASLQPPEEDVLMSYGIPIVLLNSPTGVRKLSTVSMDNLQGGFLAGSYLLKLGHRRLALLTGPEDQARVAERQKGFLRSIESSGDKPSALILHGDQSFLGGYRMAWKLISDHPEVSAVFTHNDVMAFGALKAFAEAGRRVPDEISVVGFDNVEISQMIQPALTTINQPKYEIGAAAVELLLMLKTTPNLAAPIHRVFGVSLVERQSAMRFTQSFPTQRLEPRP
ncbi:MAG: LacI family DNA-binding transcriptional regulator [Candidatus Solibacter sp.]|nr:LacI family DNA-binding transcriptional regulator [Candidatus Solibacter sp.]